MIGTSRPIAPLRLAMVNNMNKKILLLPLLVSSLLVSCGENESKSKDYNVVTFNYNNPTNQGDYKTYVVAKDEPLIKPSDPNIEDYVFKGWFLDKDCGKECLRFGLAIDSDFTLYAKWIPYSSINDVTKIDKFEEAIKGYSKNAIKVVQDVNATVGYPGAVSGEEGVFNVHDKREYKRFKDITTVDYYTLDKDNNSSLYGTRQYYYDDKKFYDIYIDKEQETDNEYASSSFDSSKVESLLSIDYYNLYNKIEESMKFYISSSKYDDETFQYEFNFNYTKLNPSLTNYVYEEAYSVATYSESAGTYSVENYTAKYGLMFEGGLIKSANVNIQYIYAIGEEVMHYVIENSIVDFYYGDGAYPEFNGTKFPYKETSK